MLGVTARLFTEAPHCTNSQPARCLLSCYFTGSGDPLRNWARRPNDPSLLAALKGQGRAEWAYRENNVRVAVFASVDTGP